MKYDFGYEIDPVWEAGNKNIPGIYIEFKEPWLNPKGFEQIVYDVLANTQDMNIIEKPEPEDTPFYINNGTINVGNTNGKVILANLLFGKFGPGGRGIPGQSSHVFPVVERDRCYRSHL